VEKGARTDLPNIIPFPMNYANKQRKIKDLAKGRRRG